MAAKHTPGPWTVGLCTKVYSGVEEINRHGSISGTNLRCVAAAEDFDIKEMEARANATLIACAPDLLGLAREIADNVILSGMELGERARELIDKATGEKA